MYYIIKNVNSSKFNELIIILRFLILFLFRESQFATLKSAWKSGLYIFQVSNWNSRLFPGLTNSRFISGFQDFPGCWEPCILAHINWIDVNTVRSTIHKFFKLNYWTTYKLQTISFDLDLDAFLSHHRQWSQEQHFEHHSQNLYLIQVW